MLTLSYLGEAKQFELEKGLNLLAVRSPPTNRSGKIVIPLHFVHAPQLSPSKRLFDDTQKWKKKYRDKSEWWYLYEQRFLRELKERDDMVRALDRLELRLKQGELVRLFCYCKDVCFCHRGYIGKEMEERGLDVEFRKIHRLEQLTLF